MQAMMKAAVLREFGKPLVLEEKPIPRLGYGEVLVQVRASGLCVSDLHIQDGIIKTVRLPYTPGHEMAGVVAVVGEGVTRVKPGDHVSAAIDILCGHCRFCLSGRTNLCESLERIGFERDGGHAQYCVIPEDNAFKVADWIPFEQLTGLPDAVGCMYNAIKNRIRPFPGDRILVLGTGGLGMNAIQIAKLFGAQVFATSRQIEKLDISLRMGADTAINTASPDCDLYEEIYALTDGQMCDAVIDNIGIKTSINDAQRLVRPGGKIVISGYNDPTFEVNYQEVMKFEKEILGLRGMTRQDFAEVIRLVETKKLTPYVYHTLPLEQVNKGLEMLRSGAAKGRIVLTMQD